MIREEECIGKSVLVKRDQAWDAIKEMNVIRLSPSKQYIEVRISHTSGGYNEWRSVRDFNGVDSKEVIIEVIDA